MPVAIPTPEYPEFRERYAQDARDAAHLDLAGTADCEWTDDAVGPILTAPLGGRWRIRMTNDGLLYTETVT